MTQLIEKRPWSGDGSGGVTNHLCRKNIREEKGSIERLPKHCSFSGLFFVDKKEIEFHVAAKDKAKRCLYLSVPHSKDEGIPPYQC